MKNFCKTIQSKKAASGGGKQTTFPKLFVVDLDGTALVREGRPYARFTDKFSNFLDALDNRGCRWAINTTWDLNGQMQVVFASKVKSRPLFLMGELGNALGRVEGDEVFPVEPYTSDTAKKCEEAREKIFWRLIKDVSSKFTPEKMYFYGHLFHFKPIRSQINEVFSYCRQSYSGETEIVVQCKGDGLVVYPSFLSKGRALAEALLVSGISPKDVVIAGDEKMDLSMMNPKLSGYLLCPRNADPEVKEYVLKNGGIVGSGDTAEGVMDAFNMLAGRHQWNWPRVAGGIN